MNKLFAQLFLMGALVLPVLPASADVAIKDVSLKEGGNDSRLRVVITNPDNYLVQEGPVRLTVYAREELKAEWKVIQVFDNLEALQPGRDVTLEVASQSNPLLKSLVHRSWEARAVLEAPKTAVAEKSVPINDASASR